MKYLFKLNYVLIWVVISELALAVYIENASGRSKTLKNDDAAIFDTLRYYDSKVSREINKKNNERYGVWFSPNRECIKLVAIEYIFKYRSTDSIAVQGFVNKVPRYINNGESLKNAGQNIANFTFYIPRNIGNSPVSLIVNLESLGKTVSVNDSDLFIGWITRFDSIPTGYEDSVYGKYTPPRSYNGLADLSSLSSRVFNLKIRAIFQCSVPEPDTGDYSFVLSWDDGNADIDVYLIIPDSTGAGKDTVYWGKRKSKSGGELDVDDTKGYGPEKITQPVITSMPGIYSKLAAYYYGPGNGQPAETWIDIFRGTKKLSTFGPCMLEPADWWEAGQVNLNSGNVSGDSLCTKRSVPELSNRSK